MAKDATFDIVSEVNMAEVTNAVNQTEREITQRYDFKGVTSEIALEKDSVKITTADEMHLKSIIDVLQSKFIKRQVPIDNLEYGKIENAAGGAVRQVVTIKQGIDKDLGKKITKDIKDTKLKVQPQFMENKIRVSGKKIDDLQAVIAKLKRKRLRHRVAVQQFPFVITQKSECTRALAFSHAQAASSLFVEIAANTRLIPWEMKTNATHQPSEISDTTGCSSA